MAAVEPLDHVGEVPAESPDCPPVLLFAGECAGGHGLVHDIPHEHTLVAAVPRHYIVDVSFQPRPVLLSEESVPGIGHPVARGVDIRLAAEAGAPQDDHHGQSVFVRRGEEMLAAAQKAVPVLLVRQDVQKGAHAVQAETPGKTQLLLDYLRAVAPPLHHVIGCVGGNVVGAADPGEIVFLPMRSHGSSSVGFRRPGSRTPSRQYERAGPSDQGRPGISSTDRL